MQRYGYSSATIVISLCSAPASLTFSFLVLSRTFFLGTACPIGSWGNVEASVDYKDNQVIGQRTCLNCLAGKWSETEGLADQNLCVPCGIGKISKYVGATSEDTCALCAAGLFSDEQSRIGDTGDCDPCPAGTSSSVEGLSAIDDCEQCVAGKFNNVPGLQECKNCLRGRYGVQVGADEFSDCAACPTGKFLSTYGSTDLTDCAECPVGFYTDEQGTQSVALFPNEPNPNDNKFFFESGTKICGCTNQERCIEFTERVRQSCAEGKLRFFFVLK